MIELSVVVPTFGRPRTILNTIKLLLSDEVEVVVVDDNGKGSEFQVETELILKPYVSLINFKYVILNENIGACGARNIGVAESSHNIISFMDDDDEPLPGLLIDKLNWFVGKRADICCSDMLIKRGDALYTSHFSSFTGVTPQEYLLNGNCYTPMIMLKKEAFIKIGGFTTARKYQDHILMLKLFINRCSVVYFKKSTFLHVEHESLRITSGQRKGVYDVRLEFEQKLLMTLNASQQVCQNLEFNHSVLRYLNDNINENVFRKIAMWWSEFSRHLLKPKQAIKSLMILFFSILPSRIAAKARRILYYRAY
jgi:glycosyltransferase involved in cell wall biosynthesis